MAIYVDGQQVAGFGGRQGPRGPEGESAYQLAVENGFTGTEAEWLASLQGPTGATGPDGFSPTVETAPNAQGDGTVVTITDAEGEHTFEVLNGLNGTDGEQGPPGKDGEGVPPGGTEGQVLTKASGADGDVAWEDLPPGGVESFNARTGAVVPQEGDYTAEMVGAISSSSVQHIQVVTQAEYEALSVKDVSTLYVIPEE